MPAPTPFANSFAVVIGIDLYGHGIPALRTAVNDARRLGELLRDAHGYELTALLDADATQARLTELLTKELPARVGPDDRVLFYFAGHGVARDGDEGPNGYLLPVDARRGDDTTYLDMPLVHDALLALNCRHMLVVLDSCFSGAFRWSGTRDVDDAPEVIHQEKFDRFVRDPAWQVITSASQDQKAIDQLSAGALGSRDGDGAHSPFALALFDALGGAGDLMPKGVGDGLLTATELYLYLDDTLQSAALEAGKRQTPRLWPLTKHDKGEFVFFMPGRELSLPPAPPLTFESNPWRGLASYDAANAAMFFGRDAEIETLRAKIANTPLTVVLGASGTGKSSLVKAGVVPRLVADGAVVLPIVRPGSTPLIAIAQALATPDRPAPDAAPDAIAARVAELVAANPGKHIVLVIDQFEELITLVRTKAERDVTLGMLASLSTTHAAAFRIVVTIRTDFEPNFDRSAFGERWREGRYVVPPMSRQNLRAVIERPATARVLYFDPSTLVDTLLDDVVATPGALPLLSFALSEMYIAYVKRQSSDRAITRTDYDALGGVVGALRSRAESEYEALDDAHKATLRRVMLRLVTSEGGGLARRRVMDDELDFTDPGEHARTDTVIQRLTAARLLVEGKEPDGEAFVEPAHDALVRSWGRLVEWVREENEAAFPLLQQQKLARAAAEWERTNKGAKSGLLWSDSSRSSQLSPLVRRRAPFLNRREMAFSLRSVRGRWIAMATAASALLMIVAAGVVAVIGGRRASARAEQVRIGAIVRTATSLVQDDPLVASQLLGNIDSSMVTQLDNATSLAMLGAALELRRGPKVLATFNWNAELTAAVLSPDAQFVASGMLNDTVQVSRADGMGVPVILHDSLMPVTSLLFSPTSDRLAVGDLNGIVRLFGIKTTGALVTPDTGAPVTLTGGDDSQVLRMQFSRDGRRILAIHIEGTVTIWNADGVGKPVILQANKVTRTLVGANADGSMKLTPIPVGIEWAEFADADRQVVTMMADSTVQFWPSAGAPKPSRTVSFGNGSELTRMAVSPDGKRVAVGGRAGLLRMLAVTADAPKLGLRRGHAGDIVSIQWSADGKRLATTATDTTLVVWDLSSGVPSRAFRQKGYPLQSAEFSPDGAHIITTQPYTFQATVWAMDSTFFTLPGHTNELVNAEFTADSRRILTASKDGSVRLWSLPDGPFFRGRGIEAEHPEGGDVAAAAFSPDGRRVVLGTRDGLLYQKWVDSGSKMLMIDTTPGTLRALAFTSDAKRLRGFLYDGTRRTWVLGGAITRSDTPYPGDLFTWAARFAADGRHVLSTTNLGAAMVWDIDAPTAPMHVALLPEDLVCNGQDNDDDCLEPESGCSALSANGSLLAACLRTGPAALYRVPDTIPARILGDSGRATGVAFSHDASRVAVGYDDGLIRIFRLDVTDTVRVVSGHRGPVKLLDFSPDDQRLLSAGTDGTVRVWDLRIAAATVTIRPKGLVIETALFTQDGRRVLTVGNGETEARLWNADGSGGFVSLPAARGDIANVYPSADGRWLLTTSTGQTADLFPLDPNIALAPFRVRSTCLPADERQRHLMESVRDARARHDACENARISRRP